MSLEKELIISGVPLENNDDPFAIIGDICGAINCNLKQGDFTAVFRLRSSSANSRNKRTLPIVARLQDDWAKQELLSNYFKKKNLNLTDIGFKTSTRIFINERLTTTNREIFNRASEAKKSNLIHRFFTRRGLVFVQRDENSRLTCITHANEIEEIFPLNHARFQSRNARGSRSFQIPINISQPTVPVTMSETSGPIDVQQDSNAQEATISDENTHGQPEHQR